MEYTESMLNMLAAAKSFLERSSEKGKAGGIPEISVRDILAALTVPNENPTVASAVVQCACMADKDMVVRVVAPAPAADERNGGLGLRELDIKLVPNTFGFCKELRKPCHPVIMGGCWKGCDSSNLIEGMPSVNMSSYMICSIGGGFISLKTNGQRVGSSEKKYIVTLEMMQNVPVNSTNPNEPYHPWVYKPIVQYDVVSSLPEYGEIRELTQEDVDEINRVLEKYEINTPERIAHFLAQCSVECLSGRRPVEKYDGEDIFEYFRKYEEGELAIALGNTQEGDGAKYRAGGALQMTGKDPYTKFSIYVGDSKILEDGALYVGKEYFWESAGYFWSVFKPNDGFMLNEMCDEAAITVEKAETKEEAEAMQAAAVHDITRVINNGYLGEEERKDYYDYFLNLLKKDD